MSAKLRSEQMLLLNLSNELGKRDKMQGLRLHVISFSQ